MALSKQNELPEEFETTSETSDKVTFDDLLASTDAVSTGDYVTITGKESRYNSEWDVYKAYEMDVNDWIEGYPEVRIIDKKTDGKSYDALHIRIIDDTDNEVLDCYSNFPRADENGFVTGLPRDFDFYRSAFDFIFSVLHTRGDKYVLDDKGEEYTKFRKVDFIGFAKLVDQMNKVKIRITEGNENSDYNSWEIISME
jgi:hypothetical protein